MAGKCIRQYDLSGKLVQEFPSMAAVMRKFNLSKKYMEPIKRCCERQPNFTEFYGYIWRYAENDELAGRKNEGLQWKQVGFLRGRRYTSYFVSNAGEVVRQVGNENQLVEVINMNGHPGVWLCDDTNSWQSFPICLIVANAFISNPTALRSVKHKDGDISNNRVSNLCWG